MRIFIGNLPAQADDASLEATLADFGVKPINLRVIFDRDTHLCKGYAFADVGQNVDQLKEMLAGAVYKNRLIRVEEANLQTPPADAQRRRENRRR